jgi:glycosyltransferase involved in cell wall biosynthesis
MMPTNVASTNSCRFEPAGPTTCLETPGIPVIEDRPDFMFASVLSSTPGEGCKSEGGLRIQGHSKQRLPRKPLVTVITVVFNGGKYLEETILSVLQQTYEHVEYIIIDGGSTDGTVEVIRKYEGQIDYWVSESDDGIYFAMNKGIEAATGDWVIFINSGDMFYGNTVLSRVINQDNADADVIYGQASVKYGSGATVNKIPSKIEDMWEGTITSHQAIFIRIGLMKEYRFDCNFKLAADHELISRLFNCGCHFLYVPEVISVVSAAGVSDTRRYDVYREFARIAGRYFPQKPFRIYFFLRRVGCFFRILAKKVLPENIIERLQTRNRNKT